MILFKTNASQLSAMHIVRTTVPNDESRARLLRDERGRLVQLHLADPSTSNAVGCQPRLVYSGENRCPRLDRKEGLGRKREDRADGAQGSLCSLE